LATRKIWRIESLNEAWGAIFWSQTYTDWSQIGPPDDAVNYKNPGHLLDYYRFASDSYVSYQQEQLDLLREVAHGQFVTHNFMGLYRDLDQFDLAGGWILPPGTTTPPATPTAGANCSTRRAATGAATTPSTPTTPATQ
jgi:beta-galactosidase